MSRVIPSSGGGGTTLVPDAVGINTGDHEVLQSVIRRGVRFGIYDSVRLSGRTGVTVGSVRSRPYRLRLQLASSAKVASGGQTIAGVSDVPEIATDCEPVENGSLQRDLSGAVAGPRKALPICHDRACGAASEGPTRHHRPRADVIPFAAGSTSTFPEMKLPNTSSHLRKRSPPPPN